MDPGIVASGLDGRPPDRLDLDQLVLEWDRGLMEDDEESQQQGGEAQRLLTAAGKPLVKNW